MFMGEYLHSVDIKGRISMPSKFRELLGETFIVTRGLDGCLFVYTREEWNNIERKLKELPFTQKDARAFTRFFFSGACECEIDKQGRVVVPQTLRDFASIDKEVVIIGVSTRVEIWSVEKWNTYTNDSSISFEEIAEKMADLGF
jgi:MraZ protein